MSSDQKPGWLFYVVTPSYNQVLREPQHTPGAYPMNPQTPK